ncbi:MAG TPA: hypothetical protein VJ911_02145, partial [Cryomorphaceae bacterium]|nr:hypothetical protein [Cryomorphaceae bacterium]
MEPIDPLKNNRFKWRRNTQSKEKTQSTEGAPQFSRIVSDQQERQVSPVGGKYPAHIDADIEELVDQLHSSGEQL